MHIYIYLLLFFAFLDVKLLGLTSQLGQFV